MTTPLTKEQAIAIETTGNCLVVAGAGAGKTRVLVERCLSLVRHQGVSLQNVLIVTFTEAAAGEIRARLRNALESAVAEDPSNWHLAEELAMLDVACIGTLHAFCLRLVREHFYELGLDPEFAVLAEDHTRFLAKQSIEAVLKRHYGAEDEIMHLIHRALAAEGETTDRRVQELVISVHRYAQTLPSPNAWFADQIRRLAGPDCSLWDAWLIQALLEWQGEWQSSPLGQVLERSGLLSLLTGLRPTPSNHFETKVTLSAILGKRETLPREQVKVLEHFFDDVEFFHSVLPSETANPLQEDFDRSRPFVMCWLQLAQEFETEFTASKRSAGGVDFPDLEQLALRLLWDTEAKKPTHIAEVWRKRLAHILVDEYQDINAAQDRIVGALAREGADSNRFLVGDVKQSIYGFRLAEPAIFQSYEALWKKAPGATSLYLQNNFRSHEGILHFVNALFSEIMQPAVGGIEYGNESLLKFGAPDTRSHLRASGDSSPVVHLQIVASAKASVSEEDSLAAMSNTAREARLLAIKLDAFRKEGKTIWEDGRPRPVDWKDMVVFLRSPRSKVETFLREFDRVGVPASARQTGFFEAMEVQDVLNVLRIIDNPEQDIPLLAVLASPFAALTPDELAVIRAESRKVPFWTAFTAYCRAHPETVLGKKTLRFEVRFNSWRKLLRHLTVVELLERIIAETLYFDWLLSLTHGAARRANVEKILTLARNFDAEGCEGLYPFLQYLEAQVEDEIVREPPPAGLENAVRLMSIHQSKGLEFPVVAVADLGKAFNQTDLRSAVILDEEYGITTTALATNAPVSYPTLPYWLAQRKRKRKLLGEEVRLLYVACTRATNYLILSGVASEKARAVRWAHMAEGAKVEIEAAKGMLDWLGSWGLRFTSQQEWTSSGRCGWLGWNFVVADDEKISGSVTEDRPAPPSGSTSGRFEPQNLRWTYPFPFSTKTPGKTSVSGMSRRTGAHEEDENQANGSEPRSRGRGQSNAASVTRGTAHHRFLELIRLDLPLDTSSLALQKEALNTAGLLSTKDGQSLDLPGLADFWRSHPGQMILDQHQNVHRELPFTYRLPFKEVSPGGLAEAREEFILMQGIVDLAVILPDQLWIVDFKTDAIEEFEVDQRTLKYKEQLDLYQQALDRIYGRPVTHAWLVFLSIGKSVDLVQRRSD